MRGRNLSRVMIAPMGSTMELRTEMMTAMTQQTEDVAAAEEQPEG